MAATNALRKTVAGLETQLSSIKGVNLSALSSELKNIANPKFNWQPALRQMDDLTSKIKKGKLSMGEYWNTYKTGVDGLVQQQTRLSRAFSQPLGSKGGMMMTIPSASQIAPTITAVESLNRKLAIQGELLSGLGTKVQDWGKNTQWAGRQMTVGLTMPLAMAALAAGKYAMDIDQSMVRIEKVYDGSTKGLRDSAMKNAMDMTKSLGVSIKSSLDAMAELAAAGKSGQEMMDLTRQAQTMSVLGNIDQTESIKAVISMQNIFSMSTKDVANSVSYLNAVEAATPTNLQDLVDAIPIAGATVKQLGGDLKDTTVLLTAFKERGISTVEGANAIKSAMNRVLAPTKAAQTLFKQFTGEDINALTKSTAGKPLETMQALSDAIVGGNIALDDQQRIISKLFGTYQSARITGLLQGLQDKNGSVAKTRALNAQSDQELNAIREKHERAITESASGQFKIAVESFKAQMTAFGDVALKVATSIIKGFGKALEIFNSLPGPVKEFAIIFGGLIAIAGPLTMLVGLFANLGGGVMKFVGWTKGLMAGVKSMTIEEKSAALSAETLTSRMITQADAAQILIFQMEKLRGAIQGVDVAQAKSAATMGPGGLKSLSGTQVVQHPITGEYYSNTGKALSDADKQYVQQQMLNREKKATVVEETKVTEATEKTSRMAKVFSSEAAIGIGAVAGIAGAMQDTNSEMGKWLNWISLGSIAIAAIGPLLGKIGAGIAGLSIGKSIVGSIKGSAGAIGSTMKTAMSSALGFMKSPVGLALGVGAIAALGVYKLVSIQADRMKAAHESIMHSTDMWTEALGRTKLVWGQIKNAAGEVKDTVDSMAEKLKQTSGPLVDRFRNVGNPQELQWMANVEVGNLQGQGLNKTEVQNSMKALLTAAGKTKAEIAKIMAGINVTFDFENGDKDIDGFLSSVRKKVNALNSSALNTKNVVQDSDPNVLPRLSGEASLNMQQQTDEIKQQFMDRLAGLSDTEKAIFSKKFTDDMAQTYFQSFADINSQYGGKLGKSWAEARQKFLKQDKDSGELVLGDEGLKLPADVGVQVLTLAKQEQDLTRAIAQQRGVNADRVKGMTILSDLLPYMTQNLGDAAAIQNEYNETVKRAAAAGHTMTDAEKVKLAQLWASVTGLDANKLATNGYANANRISAEQARVNAEGIGKLVVSLKEAANASEDLWSSIANGEAGFESLGGTAAQQAENISGKVKGMYSGAMDNIYDAFAGAASEKWEARLDALSKKFQNKKDAIQQQIDQGDKDYDKKQQAFSDAWDARLEGVKNGYEDQIKAIQDQQDAEEELEKQRQKAFDAEKRRIERLSELANANIDFNKALFGGNLDEAAKIQNNTETKITGWAGDDAELAHQDDLEKKSKANQKKIDSLKEEEDAVVKSLEKQREAEKRSMEESRAIEKERLQDKLDSLAKEQTAAEETERKKQEIQKKTLDIQLATLKAFIPQNEQQLNEHINRVGGAYGQFGLGLQGAGSMWGKIVGNALQNNVDIARQQMSSDANWQAFGASVANSVSQGAFGLNLNDFMNLLVTGKPPPGWAPPSQPQTIQQRSSDAIHYRHTGGLIDDSPGSRAGLSGGLQSSEIPIVAQRGEFMINKAAVQQLGTQNLSRINAGQLPRASTDSVGFAGFGGMVAGAMAGVMANIATARMAQYYAAQNSEVAANLGMLQGGSGAAVSFAQAQDGKPYIWGGVGPAGYDCSGYMSAIANVLTGKPPHNRLFSTGMVQNGAAFGPFEPGLGGKFQIGVSNGHTAGTLLGTNVESTGDHVRYGKDAHGATDKQFRLHFHVPDDKIVDGAAEWTGGAVDESNLSRLIVGIGKNRGFSRKGAEIALITAIVESGIRNLNHGDRDSLGIFQQRPSQGWGTAAQIMDPNYSTNKFYSALQGVKGWEGMQHGTAAQRVQRSAFPDRYQTKLGQAVQLVNQSGYYDTGGDVPPGLNAIYNGTNKKESIFTHDQQRGVLQALQNSTMSYAGFTNLLKNSDLANGVSSQINNSSGGTVNYGDINVVLQGTDKTDREIKQMMLEVIDEKKRLENKKNGRIK